LARRIAASVSTGPGAEPMRDSAAEVGVTRCRRRSWVPILGWIVWFLVVIGLCLL
jgi:hypothetical protein